MNGELLEQVLEKLSPSACLENLIDRLEGNFFCEFCFGIGIANPTDLGSSDNAEKIEVVEATGGLGKTSHQVRTQCAFGKVHVEDGCEPVGSVPGCGSGRHGDGNRAGARDLRIVDDACSTRLVRYGYNAKALEEELSRIFHVRVFGDTTVRLCIPSFEGRHGEPWIYKTPHHPDYRVDRHEKMVKVALATAAAPTFFRSLEHDGYMMSTAALGQQPHHERSRRCARLLRS